MQQISIHAPHTGRDATNQQNAHSQQEFQSTRPIRGATRGQRRRITYGADFNPRAPYGARLASSSLETGRPLNFNPRAPYGARPQLCHLQSLYCSISIHAPHTGRDVPRSGPAHPPLCISIHAPHTGRDYGKQLSSWYCIHFNPRAPYGARHGLEQRLPVNNRISIHAPHTGRDKRVPKVYKKGKNFNPRAPYGARRHHPQAANVSVVISIHAPHTGRDPIFIGIIICCLIISIHAPHTGRDSV